MKLCGHFCTFNRLSGGFKHIFVYFHPEPWGFLTGKFNHQLVMFAGDDVWPQQAILITSMEAPVVPLSVLSPTSNLGIPVQVY